MCAEDILDWLQSKVFLVRYYKFQRCDLVCHFSDIAISSHCFFMVHHFQVLQIQRPKNINDALLTR